MAILITGGAGFIGSHLVEHLMASTSEALVVVDDFNEYYDPRLKRENASAWSGQSRVTLVEADFRDSDLVTQLLWDHSATAIVHLGATPGVPESLRHPRACFENNLVGTVAVLEAARRKSVERLVFASSSTVYGLGASAPFVEDAPLGVPASPYGASKRSAELVGFTYHRLFAIPFVALRFFNVYGPRIRPELALAVFARAILQGTPLPLYGDRNTVRDFTHVSDVCRGIAAALARPEAVGEAINLGNDQPVSLERLIALIEEAAGSKALIDQRPPRPEDMPLTHADLSKARRLLGYQPQVPIERGVNEYVAWLQSRLP